MKRQQEAVAEGGGTGPLRELATRPPLADLYETPAAFVVVANMPGAARDAIEVAFDKGALTLRGRPGIAAEGELRGKAPAWERMGYQRTFGIGEAIDADRIEATFHEGVLRVVMPKADGATRKIEVLAD